jgi:hypothetical protein
MSFASHLYEAQSVSFEQPAPLALSAHLPPVQMFEAHWALAVQ